MRRGGTEHRGSRENAPRSAGDGGPRLPNLVIAGFPRCGTTWLHRTLGVRPEIFVPHRKELFYFDRNYDRGPGWYAGFFEEAGEERWRLDATPSYVMVPEIGRRMRETLPADARVIVIVRHPVDRLHSDHLLYRRSHFGVGTFRERSGDRSHLQRSLYHERISALLDRMGTERVKILVYEDLRADPRAYLSDVLGFLGLEPRPSDLPESAEGGDAAGERVNRSISVRFPRLHRLLYAVHSRGRYRQLRWLDRLLDRLRDAYFSLLPADPGRREIDPDLRLRLEEFYREDVERLGVLLGRDLLETWGFSSPAATR